MWRPSRLLTRLVRTGESRFVCGQTGCKLEWSYEEVCKKALLTHKEKKFFEKAMASNAARQESDTNLCPRCKSSVVMKNRYNLRVRQPANNRETHDLCWQCWRKQKRFTNESLKTLKTCPEIKLEAVKGVTGCPSLRACPTCGILLQHDDNYCKKVVCPRCKVGFCFVCLKLTAECLRTSGPYTKCTSGVAPRQTSIPVWQRKYLPAVTNQTLLLMQQHLYPTNN
uniref:RING-type domain-containing protein n=1 Tax=Anabas testudineus TaxID=64144 RepID=A0A7N5ZV51_ANATE